MSMAFSGKAVLVLACLLVSPAVAQNLIFNGAFDYDAVGWSSHGDTTIALVHRTDTGSTLAGHSGPGCCRPRIS